jgi:hypothetical protein
MIAIVTGSNAAMIAGVGGGIATEIAIAMSDGIGVAGAIAMIDSATTMIGGGMTTGGSDITGIGTAISIVTSRRGGNG